MSAERVQRVTKHRLGSAPGLSGHPARRFLVPIVAVAVLLTGGGFAATQIWDVSLTSAETAAPVTRPAPIIDEPDPAPSSEATPEDEATAEEPADTAPPAAKKDKKKKDAPGRSSLARNAEQLARTGGAPASAPEQPAPDPVGPTTSFRVATINVLGDSHTGGRGNKPRFRSGPARMGDLVSILNNRGLDVAGLQEFEVSQQAAFNRIAGGWAMFRGSEKSRRAVVYRTSVWTLVDGGTIMAPYFRGAPNPVPWATLRHNATGREVSFISLHNPTSNPKRGNNAVHRARSIGLQLSLVGQLSSNGAPVVLMGDFNERAEAFCKVTGAGLVAANGGSASPCVMPGGAGIDWIFGTPDISFSEYLRHQDAQVRRTTDHPVIIARATITEPLAGQVSTPMVARPGADSSS